jgi:hypothetical protein
MPGRRPECAHVHMCMLEPILYAVATAVTPAVHLLPRCCLHCHGCCALLPYVSAMWLVRLGFQPMLRSWARAWPGCRPEGRGRRSTPGGDLLRSSGRGTSGAVEAGLLSALKGEPGNQVHSPGRWGLEATNVHQTACGHHAMSPVPCSKGWAKAVCAHESPVLVAFRTWQLGSVPFTARVCSLTGLKACSFMPPGDECKENSSSPNCR